MNPPIELFGNPAWHSLRIKHRHLALSPGDAWRYPADVAPFAGVGVPTTAALTQLISLLAPGESVWLFGGDLPFVPGLSFDATLECLQMVLPDGIPVDDPVPEVIPLSSEDAAEMVALTSIAFPGFFRSRTCEMVSYYGVRCNGVLIAMGGERLMLDGYPEISGVCTYPEHRGKGLAASIIRRIVQDHRRDGLTSWLHVGSENQRAIELYVRLGFKPVRAVTLHRVSRR